MQRRADDHERVPQHIVKAQALPEMKDDARAVRHASRKQQPEGARGYDLGQGLEHRQSAETDAQIQHQYQAAEPLRDKELESYANEGGTPHEREHDIAGGSP